MNIRRDAPPASFSDATKTSDAEEGDHVCSNQEGRRIDEPSAQIRASHIELTGLRFEPECSRAVKTAPSRLSRQSHYSCSQDAVDIRNRRSDRHRPGRGEEPCPRRCLTFLRCIFSCSQKLNPSAPNEFHQDHKPTRPPGQNHPGSVPGGVRRRSRSFPFCCCACGPSFTC